jgi:hypothetical protein
MNVAKLVEALQERDIQVQRQGLNFIEALGAVYPVPSYWSKDPNWVREYVEYIDRGMTLPKSLFPACAYADSPELYLTVPVKVDFNNRVREIGGRIFPPFKKYTQCICTAAELSEMGGTQLKFQIGELIAMMKAVNIDPEVYRCHTRNCDCDSQWGT